MTVKPTQVNGWIPSAWRNQRRNGKLIPTRRNTLSIKPKSRRKVLRRLLKPHTRNTKWEVTGERPGAGEGKWYAKLWTNLSLYKQRRNYNVQVEIRRNPTCTNGVTITLSSWTQVEVLDMSSYLARANEKTPWPLIHLYMDGDGLYRIVETIKWTIILSRLNIQIHSVLFNPSQTVWHVWVPIWHRGTSPPKCTRIYKVRLIGRNRYSAWAKAAYAVTDNDSAKQEQSDPVSEWRPRSHGKKTLITAIPAQEFIHAWHSFGLSQSCCTAKDFPI